MADGMADPRPDSASELVDRALGGRMPGGGKPRLRIEAADPDVTVAGLRDVLAGTGRLFERGEPVQLAFDAQAGGMVAHRLVAEDVVRETHMACRPHALRERRDGTAEVNVALPKSLALMWLAWRGGWNLPPLDGIACAPLLDDGGGIRAREGYDPATRMWCERVPDLAGLVPERPSEREARAALLVLRRTFRTVAFADAPTAAEPDQAVPVVDLSEPPGADESGFLAGLLTATCRPSLPLAPGLLLRAAALSGSGTGKGLLARCICAVAFGRAPAAVTAGGTAEEFEKRIGAELMGGGPVVFFDNINERGLKSDTLASTLTERPARVRVLGRSAMVPLNASAFVVLTGNALDVGEDLARRFVRVELDARCEDPEARRFRGDLLAEVAARRAELLAACLTVWRWGRQQDAAGALAHGRPMGSFGAWCRWVRDPLLALGCRDPARRVAEAKARDGRRLHVAAVFEAWHRAHGDKPTPATGLAEDVRRLLDPQGRGRQHLAAAVSTLAGTRAAGFVLTRQAATGRWGTTTYQLTATRGSAACAAEVTGTHGEGDNHRDHGPHRGRNPPGAPYDPYASPGRGETHDAGRGWAEDL